MPSMGLAERIAAQHPHAANEDPTQFDADKRVIVELPEDIKAQHLLEDAEQMFSDVENMLDNQTVYIDGDKAIPATTRKLNQAAGELVALKQGLLETYAKLPRDAAERAQIREHIHKANVLLHKIGYDGIKKALLPAKLE